MIFLLIYMIGFAFQVTAQEIPLSPMNNPANINLLQTETTKMSWTMLQDSKEVKIGEVVTDIKKGEDSVTIITTVVLKQSPLTWVDSTIVRTYDFAPIYHSSYNQQRNMVLRFGEKITGFFLDKDTRAKTQLEEEVSMSFFDSNFYPQLIRLLPFDENFSKTISIFDYNPKSKTGVITATIRKVEEVNFEHEGKSVAVWKVEVTDDISNNLTTSVYYLNKYNRKILRQEIHLGGKTMVMRIVG
ncbi:DUF3108 domain-containing protein [Zobellia russellii]|uniref:DUF3108 domain-containing protein n=1 Tax=Zobellia russellii TaxID=248907 RepID=UPI001BFF167C|nr:hypothetical protein [Zobellia russellii]MBT9190450.1 hypothetical protein [Zobellia russellii]